MIEKFVNIFMENKDELKEMLSQEHPNTYKELVVKVFTLISKYDDNYDKPDVNRIHEIDDGDYQGTLVYVIGAQGYQPDAYWTTKVSYGSCSGCDTLEAISFYSSEKPSESQIEDYVTLCLHLIQQTKEI